MASGFQLYHVTSARVATQILNMGFADGEGSYMSPGLTLNGVFLSNRVLLGPFPCGVTLEVCFSISLDRLDEFEIVDGEREYREWCVPATFIKRWARVQLVEVEGPDDFSSPNADRETEIARLRTVKDLSQRHILIESSTGHDDVDWSEPTLRKVLGSK
jgi:hypothetical protein